MMSEQENPYQTPQAEVVDTTAEYQTRYEEVDNPLFSIWIRPRVTIRYIVEKQLSDSGNGGMVFGLAALAGIANSIDGAVDSVLSGDLSGLATAVLFAVFVGGIVGIVGLYIFGGLLWLAGKLIKGYNDVDEIRAAFAWSSVPTVATLPLTILFVATLYFSGASLDAFGGSEIGPLVIASMVYGIAVMVLSLWQIVLLVATISEVQRVNLGLGFLNVLLSIAIVVLPILGLFFVLK